ncbi:MAG: hypothetical protein U9N40_07875, partial [Euryarchaeota archaeon]|nr:hypothetical protein [Euryarchaeota archaeon]
MEKRKKSAINSRSIQDNKPKESTKESTSGDIRSPKISPGPNISSRVQSSSRKTARQVLREAPELTWDQTLFVDPDVFDPGYMPEQFTCREAQMRELAMQVRPALRQQVHMPMPMPMPTRMRMRSSSGAAGAGMAVVAEERRGYDHGSGQGYDQGCDEEYDQRCYQGCDEEYDQRYGNRLSSTGPGKPYNCVC